MSRAALLAVVATQTLAIGVIVALLADIQERFGFPTWSLGLIAGTSFITALAGNLTLSRVADRGHERAMILLGGVLTIGSLVSMAFADQLWHWVAARAVLGLAEGAFLPAARRVVIGWQPDDPGRALSILTTAVLIGFVVGPPAGAFLSETLGPDAPFLVPAAVTLATLLFLIPLRVADAPSAVGRIAPKEMIVHPVVAAAVMLGTSQWLIIGVIDSIWARYVTDLGGSVSFIGLSFLALVVPTILLTPLAGRLSDRRNPVQLAMVALAVEAPLIGALGVAGNLPVLIVVAILQAIVFPFVNTPAMVAVAQVSPPGQVAEAQGLIQASGLLMAGIGAIFAPALYDAGGSGWLTGGVMVALLAIAWQVWLRREKWRPVLEGMSRRSAQG